MSITEEQFTTPIPLDRDVFMRQLIASLGHLNEGILGSDVAGAYVMNVGLSMGAAIETEYKRFWGIDRPFTLDEYAHVIVDLKQKINGNFSLVSKDTTKVVVRTTSCPFDELVRRSPSLCFMTSSVFGGIAARNFGYGKTVLQKRIALGDPGCYVTVYLQRTPEAQAAVGREYVPDIEQASPDIGEQLRLMDHMQRLRQQLSEARSRWEELVHGAADAICVLGRDGTVSFANARWRDLLGIEGNELVGGPITPIVSDADRSHIEELLAQTSSGTRVTGQTWQLRHRDDTWRDVLVSASPVRDDSGAIIGTLGIFHDVTDEREAQRLKDDFLATASHELRTPVTTIRGLTDLLLRTLDKQQTLDPERLSKRLRTIQREADRLALLSVDLLEVSRLQNGRLVMQPETHDLNGIVGACVAHEQELLGESPTHQFILRCADTPFPVLVERGRLEQVLTNLFKNAVKYSPGGGTITVTTSAAGTSAVVQVADQGIGIPEQDLSKLFRPFYRSSNASSRNFSGLGLGLYLSKTFVEAMGGTISMSSSEGQGTTVTLTLPIDAESLSER